jgi:hypothetical protein
MSWSISSSGSSFARSRERGRAPSSADAALQCQLLYDFEDGRFGKNFFRNPANLLCNGVVDAFSGFEQTAIGGDELIDVCGAERHLDAATGYARARSATSVNMTEVSNFCHMSAVEAACGMNPADGFLQRPKPALNPLLCYCRAQRMCSGMSGFSR